MSGDGLALGVAPLVAGIAMGVLAFLPLLPGLAPVLKGRNEARLLRGVLGLAISFLALMAIVFAIHALAPELLLSVAIGVIAGFLGCVGALCVRLLVQWGK